MYLKKIDTDSVMEKIYYAMAHDFDVPIGNNRRSEVVVHYDDPSPYRLKQRLQVRDFLKRYIFRNDQYSPQALVRQSLEDFASFQAKVVCCRPESSYVFLVLQEARKIAKSILGRYDEGEHQSYCRFGSRAARLVPRKNGGLDRRLENISGTLEHLRFLSRAKLSDALLRNLAPRKNYRVVDALELTCVPKSWKTCRTIMPDTVAGGFYSSGLGKVIELRLRAAGYDIRFLSETHKRLARRYSKSRIGATADLSKASDSITSWHLNCILPREWYRAVSLGRAPYARVKGVGKIRLTTFMAMGIGFTFPLQTLCFLSLLLAIKKLLATSGRVSVFGDDLIYPSSMHTVVAAVFRHLGFTLNADKTFVSRPYRESCGGDYYHGVDVRPCMPEGVGAYLTTVQYEALLYKLFNSLSARWTLDVELPSVFGVLMSEILKCNPYPYTVPDWWPDYSGLKGSEVVRLFQHLHRRDSANSYLLPDHLQVSTPLRKVEKEEPYYWAWLANKHVADNAPVRATLDIRLFALTYVSRERLECVKSKWNLHLPTTGTLVYRKKNRRAKQSGGSFTTDSSAGGSLRFRRCVHRRTVS